MSVSTFYARSLLHALQVHTVTWLCDATLQSLEDALHCSIAMTRRRDAPCLRSEKSKTRCSIARLQGRRRDAPLFDFKVGGAMLHLSIARSEARCSIARLQGRTRDAPSLDSSEFEAQRSAACNDSEAQCSICRSRRVKGAMPHRSIAVTWRRDAPLLNNHQLEAQCSIYRLQ